MDEAKAQSFCCWFVKLGNVHEAAVQAGFSEETALEEGLRILRRPKYRRLVQEMRAIFAGNVREQVMSGLERLAFGDVSDAVRLALQETEGDETGTTMQSDLYNVSEIKRVKGGGMEIKFFDRQKALEKMMEYAGNADQRAAARSLLSAIAGADADDV